MSSLADRIRTRRQSFDWTLDDLASVAGVSKTYLWELEKDQAGVKRPSADMLGRIAVALDVPLLELLGQSVTSAMETPPASLRLFADRMSLIGDPLSDQDIADLAAMRFRGDRPMSVDGWHALYLLAIQWP